MKRMSNTDRMATFVVDKVIDSAKSHFGDKVPASTFDMIRPAAVHTATGVIPLPLRLGINAAPASAFENILKKTEVTVTKAVEDGMKTITPGMLSNAADASTAVSNIAKTVVLQAVERTRGFFKEKPVGYDLEHTRPGGLAGTAPPPPVEARPPVSTDAPKGTRTFFYMDANGRKQGPVDGKELKRLASQGVVKSETMIESDGGRQATAEQIRGLFPAAPSPQPSPSRLVPPQVPVPPPLPTPPPLPVDPRPVIVATPVVDDMTKTQQPASPESTVTEMMLITILSTVLGILCIMKFFGLPWVIFIFAAIVIIVTILFLLDKKEDRELDYLIGQGDMQAMHKRARKHQQRKEWNKAKQLFTQLVDQEYPGAKEALDQCIRSERLATYQCNFDDIFEAAERGTADAVGFFVERKGARVNAGDYAGRAPLHYAAQNNSNIEVMEYLISRGADVNAQVYTGRGLLQTPLDLADTEEKKSLLHKAGGLSALFPSAGQSLPPPDIGRISPYDYLVFIRVLETLKMCGYRTYAVQNEAGRKWVGVSRDGNTYGWVFVVADPTPGLASGLIGIFSEDYRKMRYSNTQHASMQRIIEIVSARFKRKGYRVFEDYDEDKYPIGVFWPEDSNVGCYTDDPNKEYNVYEFLPIVRSAMVDS